MSSTHDNLVELLMLCKNCFIEMINSTKLNESSGWIGIERRFELSGYSGSCPWGLSPKIVYYIWDHGMWGFLPESSLEDCHPGTKGPNFLQVKMLLVHPLVIWALARWIKLRGLLPAWQADVEGCRWNGSSLYGMGKMLLKSLVSIFPFSLAQFECRG